MGFPTGFVAKKLGRRVYVIMVIKYYVSPGCTSRSLRTTFCYLWRLYYGKIACDIS